MATSVPSSRFIIPALSGLYGVGSTISYPLMRFVAGAWLMPHGAQKLFGLFGSDAKSMAAIFSQLGFEPALPLTYVVGCVEFFGGLLIAIGLLTRPAAVAASVMLVVAAFEVHWPNGYFWTDGGFEYPLMWAFMMIGIVLRGGGNLSVDSLVKKEF